MDRQTDNTNILSLFTICEWSKKENHGNIFVIKTTTDRYLRDSTVCFIDLEKAIP